MNIHDLLNELENANRAFGDGNGKSHDDITRCRSNVDREICEIAKRSQEYGASRSAPVINDLLDTLVEEAFVAGMNVARGGKNASDGASRAAVDAEIKRHYIGICKSCGSYVRGNMQRDCTKMGLETQKILTVEDLFKETVLLQEVEQSLSAQVHSADEAMAAMEAAIKALQDELQETKQKLALSERIHEEKRLGIYYDDK